MGPPRGTRARCRQAQHLIPGQLSNHPTVRVSGIDIDGANNGMFLPDRGANAASNINRASPMTRH
ncbi:AHH domain-containing protein [Paracoccus siganidrum]